jgi:DNA adenine methylase
MELMKPLIKWAGGKRHIASVIEAHLPGDWAEGTYYEPFIGGAAIYLHLQPKKAQLSDVNEKLIGFYNNVKTDSSSLRKQIRLTAQKFDASPPGEKLSTYLKFREDFNKSPVDSLGTSALFFALNKLCFNGLYRENSSGAFNVPFGKKTKFPEFDEVHFAEVSKLFQNSKIHVSDFESALKSAKSGDFVYLDPPYIPVDSTSNFTSYSSGGFGLDSQERLADTMRDLAGRGVRAMLSNSSTPMTKKVYKGFRFVEISAPRMVSAKSSGRGQIAELLIMNY